jgi:hypothetical protein
MRIEPENIKERNQHLLIHIQKNLAITIVLVSMAFYFIKILFF